MRSSHVHATSMFMPERTMHKYLKSAGLALEWSCACENYTLALHYRVLDRNQIFNCVLQDEVIFKKKKSL